MEESVPARAKSRARRHLLYPRNKYELVPFSLSARTWASASSRYRERASMVVLQSLRSRRIMESARTMSSSSSRYVENMAHVQAGEVHVNCPSIMTVSSGKGHTTTLTPTMCRLSLACGTATMVVVARPLCLLDMRGTSIDKAPTLLSGHRVGAMRFVVEHLRTSAFVGTSALSARSMPLSYP